MKKSFSVSMCLALIFSMTLLFTGCGGSDKDVFIGKWESKVDLSSMFNKQFEEQNMGKDIIDEFNLTLIYEFKEDDTCKITVDEEAFKISYDKFIDDISIVLEKTFEEQAKSAGITLDDLLKTQGFATVKELIKSQMKYETILSSFSSANTTGSYKLEDGMLLTADGTYINYEIINKNEIKFNGVDGKTNDLSEDLKSALSIMYKTTLVRK